LRDIIENVSAQSHRIYYLGYARLSPSNLSRINASKPYTLCEALFGHLLASYQNKAPNHNFRFKNEFYSLNTSTIDLHLSMFPWAEFRSTKDEEKLHVGLNHRVYLPEIVTVTDGKKSYITVGRILKLPKFSIVAIDISYNDYAWYK
jgi:hypothetical protein